MLLGIPRHDDVPGGRLQDAARGLAPPGGRVPALLERPVGTKSCGAFAAEHGPGTFFFLRAPMVARPGPMSNLCHAWGRRQGSRKGSENFLGRPAASEVPS